MKWLGAVLLVAASLMIGIEIRGQKTKTAKTLGLLGDWLLFVRDEIEFANATIVAIVEKSAAQQRFAALGFLENAAQPSEANATLGGRLLAAFRRWDMAARFDADSVSAIETLLAELGRDAYETELEKLALGAKRLETASGEELEKLKQMRGFYETIAALAGITVALILI